MLHLKGDTIVYPLPDDKLLDEYEEFWQVQFPEDYRAFLKQYNGVQVVENAIPTARNTWALVRFFCALNEPDQSESGCYDLMVVESPIEDFLTDDEDADPVKYAPIGEVFGGCFFCLDYHKGPKNPGVCILDVENSGEFEPVTYPVAKSFSEFLSLLKIPEDLSGLPADYVEKQMAQPHLIEFATQAAQPAKQEGWKWPWQR